MSEKQQRLSKVLASAGVASRRKCEEMIFAHRVRVNGTIASLPQTLVGSADELLVDGALVTAVEQKFYFLLNKPKGYICSAKGNQRSKLVLELFTDISARLFTVGRLDKETQGLLLVTNDGHFANDVIHPSKNIHKEYLLKTGQEITIDHLAAISNGTLVEGVFVKPIRVKKVRKGTVKVVVTEGKKREVRLLAENAGLIVHELTRIRIGGLHLGSLPLGGWRFLTERERQAIFNG